MGFNDQEIVALSGAHSLGRCHPDASGYSVYSARPQALVFPPVPTTRHSKDRV